MIITFEAQVIKIGSRQVIKIPFHSSKKLPSRGMVVVQGTINNKPFSAVALEPDGKGSHWLEVTSSLSEKVNFSNDEDIIFNIEPLDEWPEPEIPSDLMDTIERENLLKQWNSITTKARWDWLRWIRATENPQTRNKRIEVASSKLKNGDTNPCCFDRTRCTVTDVSKSGILLDY